MSVVPEPASTVPDATAEKSVPLVATTSDNNPGSFEELHRKCREVFPMCFEGAKVMVQKGLSSHFQVSFICFTDLILKLFVLLFSSAA